ncbi:MAG: hypothetical protein A2991_00480 [Candidatus Terrybacteria bacterium RIFCSPLOWO2_01_FULL_58_14]|uniref:Serine aminopeptidase S33 domain-containing protein n=1 Tax=Candidatus Terrybacteria bacterium RIFCSPLOWO2_01_FULL_58_14 TaxID=1802369 RepID=A0A1G2PYD3_9BACT|nr:MAG: hypothetical protein A2991_00480 [Candidatus Terrybacteria bacterium RIFCSPLOWO2_01_FULL_58_14]
MLVELTRIVTADGVPLDGAIADAKGRKRAAVLFVHGLTSTFSRSRALWESLARAGQHRGIGVAAFNTRGHDIIASYAIGGRRRKRYRTLGAALEDFRDCIHDLHSGIRFLKKRGYRRILLVGHSTGAQKTAYYLSQVRDRAVAGLVLAGPLSDVAIRQKQLGKTFSRNIAAVERFAKRHGKTALLPPTLTWGYWSAQRYLSLFKPGNDEDIFPYHNPKARWTNFRRIHVPTLILIGARDEHLDRSAEELIAAFRAHAPERVRLHTLAISRAGHNFRRHENAFSTSVIRWIERTI